MKQHSLFDNLARVLASPMPRRQAFKHILGGIAGAALATTFWPEDARADPTPVNGKCPGNHFSCNGVVCCNLNTQTCCGVGASSVCCKGPRVCVNGQCVQSNSPT